MAATDAPLTEDDGSFYVDRDGELEEISPDEHPRFEFVITIHGIPQSNDEPDIDDNGYLVANVGRIGDHYYEQDAETRRWAYLGAFDTLQAAADHAAGADFAARFEAS